MTIQDVDTNSLIAARNYAQQKFVQSLVEADFTNADKYKNKISVIDTELETRS